MKIKILGNAFVNRKILAEECEIVEEDPDYYISDSFPPGGLPLEKLIYLTSEPPLCMPRIYYYSNFHKMPLVVRYGPKKPNEISITINNCHGAEFPFSMQPFDCELITREDTTIKNRGVFYAGGLGLENNPSLFGSINIRKIRRQLVEYFQEKDNCFVMGEGTKRGPDFTNARLEKTRAGKIQAIDKSGCDFVLAIENSFMEDYVTEKIGDGFTSDRVVLYLGASNIEKHVPLNCFIDLRPYVDWNTLNFDLEALQSKINSITQEQYDEILSNARTFRNGSYKKYQENMDDLTHRIISFLKNLKK